MITEFIAKKLKTARYKILTDGTYFGGIAGLPGVWANADNLEDCRHELQEVLEDWILLKIRSGERIHGFALKLDRRVLAR